MCLVFCVMNLPVLSLWLCRIFIVVTVVNLFFTLYLYGPPSSCCMATQDPMGKWSKSLWVSLSLIYLIWWALKVSYRVLSLLIFVVHFVFLCRQPCIMHDFSFWGSASSQVTACMYSYEVHTGIFSNVLMTCMFMFMSVDSWSLFSVWLLWNNQFTIYRSLPGLYIMCTLYWWMHSMMYCKHWNNMACGQWWCMLL